MQAIEKAFLPYVMRFTNITWCNEYKGTFVSSGHGLN